jgi:hypothetical protein
MSAEVSAVQLSESVQEGQDVKVTIFMYQILANEEFVWSLERASNEEGVKVIFEEELFKLDSGWTCGDYSEVGGSDCYLDIGDLCVPPGEMGYYIYEYETDSSCQEVGNTILTVEDVGQDCPEGTDDGIDCLGEGDAGANSDVDTDLDSGSGVEEHGDAALSDIHTQKSGCECSAVPGYFKRSPLVHLMDVFL